jgi:acetyl esterase/lipase
MNIIDAIPNHSARIFSLDYSLVPESRYPTQLQQIAKAYEYLLTTTSADKIIVAGDSAGAALLISFLLHINRPCPDVNTTHKLSTPAALLLISPWCHINSRHTSTSRPARAVDEDFLDTAMLDEYARLYTGATTPSSSLSFFFPLKFYIAAFKGLYEQLLDPPYTSKWITRAKLSVPESRSDPKDSSIHSYLCKSPYRNPFAVLDYPDWLADAIPNQTMVIYGGKEVMAGDIIEFTNALKRVSKGTVEVHSRWKWGWHAWPMILMYLGTDSEETGLGVRLIADFITRKQ